MSRARELCAAEDVAWVEFLGLVESITPEQMERPGYLPEGWSVKDLLGHIGSWQAEAATMLIRIRYGTYVRLTDTVDERNTRFFEANRDLPLDVVRAECWAGRNRMLEEWAKTFDAAGEGDAKLAEGWFVESGASHYEEHLPRLREWTSELRRA